MNNKIQNISLFKTLIDSNFLILNKKYNKNLRYFKYISDSSIGDTTLNIFETLKSIKQFIRILQFLNRKKEIFLHILVENKQHSDLIAFFFKEKTTNVFIKNFLSKKKVSKKTLQFLLLLSDSLNNDKKTLKSIIDKNIFLINKINSKLEKNNWGIYKIYNDLYDFKKLVFLLVILDIILKNKKN